MLSTSLSQRVNRWYEYEKDSHQKTLSMLHSVPASRRDDPLFQKAVDKFAHVIYARRMWLFRFGKLAARPQQVFPSGVELEALADLIDETYRLWDAHMSSLRDEEILRTFRYQSLDGDSFENTVEDILLQLHGHSLYHRGQVATLVSLCGGTAVDTDFVYWSRRNV